MSNLAGMVTRSSEKPFLNVLNKEHADKTPFWFMRQAGRYLPEYRELRQSKNGFLDLAFDPQAATEVTLQPIRRFGMDAAVIFSDILTVPHALGQKLEFVEGEGPKLDPVRSAEQIKKLNFKDFKTRMEPVYEVIKGVRSGLEKEGFKQTATIGFAGAPWTVACYMIQGGGSKDFLEAKKLAYQDPETFGILMELLIEATASYLINQVSAGAEAIQIFDSWAGVLDSEQFRRWVVRPTYEIVNLVREVHPHVPIIGFPRGAGENYMGFVQSTNVNGVSIDSNIATRWAAHSLQPFVTIQGNLDPICLLAGGDSLKLAVERIFANLKDGSFIFNLGHGIHKDTPVEHVEELVKIIRSY